MKSSPVLVLLLACDAGPRHVRIHLITPAEEDPIATVEEYVLGAEHWDLGGARKSFAADEAPFELPAIEPGDGWTFEVEGRVLGAPWAYGRSCPTDIPTEGALPEPVVYFSLLRQFSHAGAMDGARVWPTLLPMADGDALVVGGDPPSAPTRYALEHAGFDPASGPAMGIVQFAALEGGFLLTGETADAWRVSAAGEITSFSAPEAARVGARLTPLGDGRVLLTGGEAGSPFPVTTWIFDPDRGAFGAGPGPATPRRDHTASDVGRGNVLVLGGRDANSNALRVVEVLSDGMSPFTAGDLDSARWQHTATVLADNQGVLLVGGWRAMGDPLADVEIYDPTGAGSTTSLATSEALAFPRAGHTATPIGGGRFVLIAGGWGAGGTPVPTAELYDVERRQFRPTDDLRSPRAAHAALVLCDGKVLFVGGEGEGSDTAEIYNPDPMLVSAPGHRSH